IRPKQFYHSIQPMKILLIIILSLLLLSPLSLGALIEYTPLAPLTTPSGGELKPTNLNQYLAYMFQFLIAFAGVLAVVRIVWGGIMYMSTEAIAGKGDAKEIIKSAVWGLILAISAYLILSTINPEIFTNDGIKTRIFQGEQTSG
ncbi:MAG: hypothetical protein Q7S15_00685, partial [bacterium]|nr:hypothetical protein [bacterium]